MNLHLPKIAFAIMGRCFASVCGVAAAFKCTGPCLTICVWSKIFKSPTLYRRIPSICIGIPASFSTSVTVMFSSPYFFFSYGSQVPTPLGGFQLACKNFFQSVRSFFRFGFKWLKTRRGHCLICLLLSSIFAFRDSRGFFYSSLLF